jgi:hypothetical protein
VGFGKKQERGPGGPGGAGDKTTLVSRFKPLDAKLQRKSTATADTTNNDSNASRSTIHLLHNGTIMFSKCATAIIIAALTGAVLLGLRQQRFETMHNMAKLHAGMNSTRQTLWNLQTRVAGQIEPSHLQDAVTAANLPFETFTPSAPVHQVASHTQNQGLNLLKTTPSDIDLADGQPAPGPERITTASNKTQKPAAPNKAGASGPSTTSVKKNTVAIGRRDTAPIQLTSSRSGATRH